MPCRPWEEDAQINELPHLVTPTKPLGNDGVMRIRMPKISLTQSDEGEESLPKKKRKRVLATYYVVKRWVTGYRAEQPEEDVEQDFLEQARHLMHLSGLKKLPCHKSLQTNLDLWKRAGGHTSRCVQVTLYLCPLRNRCKCMCGLWVLLAAILSSFSDVVFTMQAPMKMMGPSIVSTNKSSRFMTQP
jgi:hypothetical protein